jgi:hypothetical protein
VDRGEAAVCPEIELADATPGEALRTFLLALAAQYATTLRAVTLPDKQLDWSLKAKPISSTALAELKQQLAPTRMRRVALR